MTIFYVYLRKHNAICVIKDCQEGIGTPVFFQAQHARPNYIM